MTDTPIYLVDSDGASIGKLSLSVLELVAKSENTARSKKISKRSALPLFFSEYLETQGYQVEPDEQNKAILDLKRVCKGETLPIIQIVCSPTESILPGNNPERQSTHQLSNALYGFQGSGNRRPLPNGIMP